MKKSNGQAMTEFLITTSFILLPLFLGIPMLGKYIDLKHATIQAARYEAWEYTTWYNSGDSNDILDNFDEKHASGARVRAPQKSLTATRNEARHRFFTALGQENPPAIKNTDSGGWKLANRNPTWVDHKGQNIYSGVDGSTSAQDSQENTPTIPVIGQVLNAMIDVLDFAFSAIGTLVGLLGSSIGFTAMNTDGYSTSTVSIKARTPVFMNTRDLYGANTISLGSSLNFSSSAGVLTDGWNSGGTEHVYNQTAGTVPSVLLKELLTLGPMGVIWDIIAILAPELQRCHPSIDPWNYDNGPGYKDGSGSLWLGHIDADAVHPDRLSGGGTHECTDDGICKFVPNVAPRDKDCIP